MAQEEIRIDARMATLESEMEGLRGQFTGLASQVNTKFAEQSALIQRLVDDKRTPWGTLGTWAALLVTIGTLGVGLLGYTLNTQMLGLKEEMRQNDNLSLTRHEAQGELIRINSDRTSETRVVQSAMQSELQRVETQMAAGSNYRNLQVSHQHLLIDQLWQKQFGQVLRDPGVYPLQGADAPR